MVLPSPLPAGLEQLGNQGTITSNEVPDVLTDDPDTGTGDDPTITPVVAAPDLNITKTDGGISAAAGGTVVYTLTWANVGNQTAASTTVTETVPTGSTFDAGSSTAGWTCVPDTSAGSTCTQALGDVLSAASGMLDFAVLVDSPLASGISQLSNTASTADDGTSGPDPTPLEQHVDRHHSYWS